jgi:hypothetical protein
MCIARVSSTFFRLIQSFIYFWCSLWFCHPQWTRALGAVKQSLQSHASRGSIAPAASSPGALAPAASSASVSSGRLTAAQLCAQLTELFAALPDADVTDLKQTEQVGRQKHQCSCEHFYATRHSKITIHSRFLHICVLCDVKLILAVDCHVYVGRAHAQSPLGSRGGERIARDRIRQ